MKLFLSSTTKDLTDARLTFIKQFEEICENKIELVSYEKYGQSSTLGPEETCIDLVNKCQALMLLLDRYYGTICSKDSDISITHAEVKKALELGLHIIPIVRKQTWYEFKVWKKNKGVSINFERVEDPRLFEILEELYNKFNCHCYEDFTSLETMSKIAKDIVGMIKDSDLGALNHIALI